jgi:hypothetical protein
MEHSNFSLAAIWKTHVNKYEILDRTVHSSGNPKILQSIVLIVYDGYEWTTKYLENNLK